MILSQILISNAQKNLGRGAFRYLGKETNYGELKTRVAKLSYLYLHELGEKARVAIVASNGPAYISTFFALSNTRSVCIPVDPTREPAEILACLKESKATHVAVSSDQVNRVREILQSEHLGLPLIEIERKVGGEYDPTFTPQPDHAPQETDVVLLLRTAGTTGRPRYVPLTHKQLHHAALSLRGLYHSQPADRFLTTLNWSNPFGIMHGMLYPLLTGATAVIDNGLEAAEFLAFLYESRVSRIVGTPPFFHKLLLTCKSEEKGLPGVKSITVGVGTLSADYRRIFKMLKVKVGQCYGQAEAVWTLAMADLEDETDPEAGFVGQGLAGLKYKVLGPDGDEVAAKGGGERSGHLAVMGPSVMSGYFENEAASKVALRGTWLYTGDYARLTGDNDTLRIHLIGRKDDVAYLDGRLLPASRVDGALKGVVNILDAAGFFVLKSMGKPVLCCAVVKVQGSPLTEKHVLDICAEKLPGESTPQIAVFVDAIPHDAGGVVKRGRLSQQYAGTAG